MPTEMETRVLVTLSAVEVPPGVAEIIESWGNEAVTVTCDVALGDYPGTKRQVRGNAVALLGWMSHPQAKETIALLLTDDDPDVAARALRAAGRHADESATPIIAGMLRRADLSPLLAAEAVQSLTRIGSSEAREALEVYEATAEDELPHRGSQVVATHLARYRAQS